MNFYGQQQGMENPFAPYHQQTLVNVKFLNVCQSGRYRKHFHYGFNWHFYIIIYGIFEEQKFLIFVLV